MTDPSIFCLKLAILLSPHCGIEVAIRVHSVETFGGWLVWMRGVYLLFLYSFSSGLFFISSEFQFLEHHLFWSDKGVSIYMLATGSSSLLQPVLRPVVRLPLRTDFMENRLLESFVPSVFWWGVMFKHS